jgi:hypothetical protein
MLTSIWLLYPTRTSWCLQSSGFRRRVYYCITPDVSEEIVTCAFMAGSRLQSQLYTSIHDVIPQHTAHEDIQGIILNLILRVEILSSFSFHMPKSLPFICPNPSLSRVLSRYYTIPTPEFYSNLLDSENEMCITSTGRSFIFIIKYKEVLQIILRLFRRIPLVLRLWTKRWSSNFTNFCFLIKLTKREALLQFALIVMSWQSRVTSLEVPGMQLFLNWV